LIPKPTNKSGDRRARQNKNSGGSTDSLIVASHHAAARGDVLFDAADLTRKRNSFALTQSPPRNFLNQIHWIQASYEASINISSAGTVVEANQAFSLNQFPDAGNIAALFDQYCIYAIHSRLYVEPSSTTAVAALSYGELYSATDFDSASNLGSTTAIQRYSSCQQSELVLGKSYERFVKPCVPIVTGSGNSTSNTGVAINRLWVNSVSSTVPHFGIRYLTANNQSGTAPLIRIVLTAIFGCRNNI
jgi:hypothetical protein